MSRIGVNTKLLLISIIVIGNNKVQAQEIIKRQLQGKWYTNLFLKEAKEGDTVFFERADTTANIRIKRNGELFQKEICSMCKAGFLG